jgi:hypothetical protein
MASQGVSQILENEEEESFANPSQVYKRFLQIVTNETISPEVLPYEEAVFDLIMEQVKHMTGNLNRLRTRLVPFCIEQHSLELQRFAFVINKYMRTRLQKIETNSTHLVELIKSNRSEADRIMSPNEIKFLDRYVSSINTHLEKTVLSKLPSNMTSFKMTDVETDEQLEYDCHYVFVKALKDMTITVDDPVTGLRAVQMTKGSQHFLPFSAVRKPLMQGSKDLLLL